MRESLQIKQKLLEDFKQALTPKKLKSTSSHILTSSYAAILLSIVNYGYNVANRRPLPSSAFAGKETGLNTYTLKEEEHYLRSESHHPSRRVYQKLKICLQEFKQADINKEELLYIIEEHEKRPRHGAWLGQWKSPEEVLEIIFAKLSLEVVQLICLNVVDQELADLQTYFTTDFKKTTKAKEKITPPKSSPVQTNFKTIMQKRMEIVKNIAAELKKVQNDILPNEAAATGYPCITFDLRNLAKEYKIEYKEFEPPPDQLTNFNKCLMCYFSGLINFYSMQTYGENFVWTQPQSSFGNLRPSFADTDKSFRFSPGLIPDDFHTVIIEAYKSLVTALSDPKVKEILAKLVIIHKHGPYVFHESWMNENAQLLAMQAAQRSKDPVQALGVYLQQIEQLSLEKINKEQVEREQQELAKAAAEKAKQEQVVKDSKLTSVDQPKNKSRSAKQAEQEEIKKLAREEKLRAEVLQKQQQQIEKAQEEDHRVKVIKQRTELFESTTLAILTPKSGGFKKAVAPEELSILLEQLITLAEIKTSAEVVAYSLSAFESRLNEMIQTAVQTAKKIENDFSETASAIETLTRLLKIKYELNIIYRREQRCLAEPELLRTISRDSTLSEETFATRSGMSAFATIYQGFHKTEKPRIASFDELYFEISTDIFQFVAKEHTKNSKKQGKKTQKKNVTDKSDKLKQGPFLTVQDTKEDSKIAEIHFIDIAAFPRKPIGQSNQSPWKDSWEDLIKSQPETLIVDVTSATQDDLDHLYDQFSQQPDQKPYVMITFSSNNKFAQMGVDLVCMGELRFFRKKPQDLEKSIEMNELCDSLRQEFHDAQENCTAAKAYRALLRDLNQRPSLKHKKPSMGFSERKTSVPDSGVEAIFKLQITPLINTIFRWDQDQKEKPSIKYSKIHIELMEQLKQIINDLETEDHKLSPGDRTTLKKRIEQQAPKKMVNENILSRILAIIDGQDNLSSITAFDLATLIEKQQAFATLKLQRELEPAEIAELAEVEAQLVVIQEIIGTSTQTMIDERLLQFAPKPSNPDEWEENDPEQPFTRTELNQRAQELIGSLITHHDIPRDRFLQRAAGLIKQGIFNRKTNSKETSSVTEDIATAPYDC